MGFFFRKVMGSSSSQTQKENEEQRASVPRKMSAKCETCETTEDLYWKAPDPPFTSTSIVRHACKIHRERGVLWDVLPSSLTGGREKHISPATERWWEEESEEEESEEEGEEEGEEGEEGEEDE